MAVIFIVLTIWIPIFLIALWSAIVDGNKYAPYVIGICVFMFLVCFIGIK